MAIALGPLAGPSTPSPRTQLLTNLTTTSALLTQLFTSLSSPHAPNSQSTSNTNPNGSTNANGPASISAIYAALQNTTSELESISKEIRTHQIAYERLKSREAEVRELEGDVRRTLVGLESARSELEGVVDEGREVLGSVERLEKEPINVPVLLSHARNLAKHSSAPVSTLLQPIDKAQSQPWPTETSMRQGILFAEGGSMVGLGDVGHQVAVDVNGAAAAADAGDGEMEWERRETAGPGPVFTLDLNSDSEEDD